MIIWQRWPCSAKLLFYGFMCSAVDDSKAVILAQSNFCNDKAHCLIAVEALKENSRQMEPIVYQEMRPGEEAAVCELVAHVFNEWVAPDYEQEGIEEFFRFANPSAMAERVRSGGFVLVAMQLENIVGALEFALPDRIAMLFVTLQKQGIAKELVARAIEKARSENPALLKVTVHSSPCAEAAYQRMGFRQTGNDTTEHGIRYIPMELPLERRNA